MEIKKQQSNNFNDVFDYLSIFFKIYRFVKFLQGNYQIKIHFVTVAQLFSQVCISAYETSCQLYTLQVHSKLVEVVRNMNFYS